MVARSVRPHPPSQRDDLRRSGCTDRKRQTGGGNIEPRLLAFLAYLSALGLLTMKGMVEAQGDPLIYSDERLIDGFTQLFAAVDRS